MLDRSQLEVLDNLSITHVFKSHSKRFWVEESSRYEIRLKIISDQVVIGGVTSKLTKEILVKDCVFKKPVSFVGNSEYNANVKFENCEFDEGLNFEGGDFSYFLTISNATLGLPLKFEAGVYSQVEIKDCNYLRFIGGKFTELRVTQTINEEKLADCELKLSRVTGSIALHSIKFSALGVTGLLTKETSVKIEDCKFQHLKFWNFTNDGQLKVSQSFMHVPKTDGEFLRGSFQVFSSNLTTAEFYSINFENAVKFEFNDAIISQCIFANIKWNYTLFHLVFLDQRRELFRQLKVSYRNVGDHIFERIFHGFEMNTHLLHGPWKENPSTKLIIWFSWFTSNYGQSLWRPIRFMLIINVFAFGVLVYNGYITNLTPRFSFTSEALGTTFAEFVKWNNPFRRVEDQATGWGYLLDIVMRIVSSYMIYNIIRATRRFIN